MTYFSLYQIGHKQKPYTSNANAMDKWTFYPLCHFSISITTILTGISTRIHISSGYVCVFLIIIICCSKKKIGNELLIYNTIFLCVWIVHKSSSLSRCFEQKRGRNYFILLLYSWHCCFVQIHKCIEEWTKHMKKIEPKCRTKEKKIKRRIKRIVFIWCSHFYINRK